MARSRAPTFEQQRSAIRTEAARLFAEKGFASASMSQIAQACQVSKALLYHYYRDKPALLLDIVESYLDTLLAIGVEAASRPLEPEEHLRELIARFMRQYEHAQPQHRVLVQDVKFLDEHERSRITAKQRSVVDAFARAIARVHPKWDGETLRVPLAMILFGMINWTFTWLRAEGPLTYEDMAGVVSDIFLHGVTGPGAAGEAESGRSGRTGAMHGPARIPP